MKKNIACPSCKGKGYNTVVTGDRSDYVGVANEMCSECDGTGVKLVEATNADRIRAMSDEELADFITDKEKGWCTEIGREMYYQHNLEWLQQPAEVE